MAKITVIPPTINPLTRLPNAGLNKRRVAGYARVSTDQDEQFTSYQAQIDYYSKFIQANPEWEFVEVYTDEGISGTNAKKRDGFQRMIADALDGKIDHIVTKSVSRFARNTVDSLTYIRTLKEKGVECYFEKENIYTFDGKGELLITIMSSLAQEESRSISENVTWGKRKAFSDGKVFLPYNGFLGYEKGEDGKPKIIKEEAEVVRFIYKTYLEGKTAKMIAEELTEMGIKTPREKDKWSVSTVISILKNEKYKGDALLQKAYIVDFLEHKLKKNSGEVQQYYVENSHQAIIVSEEWEQVQLEMKRRNEMNALYTASCTFSSKLICEDCGGYYGQKLWHSNNEKYRRLVWQCNDKFKKDKDKCQTPTLNEKSIKTMFLKAYNEFMSDRTTLIEDCKLMATVLVDFDKLDSQLNDLQTNLSVTEGLVKELVEKNATTIMSQEEFVKKYESLKKKHDDYYEKYQKLLQEKENRISQSKAMSVFIKGLEEKPLVLEEWDYSCWQLFVEKGIVHRDKSITFVFYNDRKIRIGAEK